MFILVQNKAVNEPLFPFLSTSLNLNASHVEQNNVIEACENWGLLFTVLLISG